MLTRVIRLIFFLRSSAVELLFSASPTVKNCKVSWGRFLGPATLTPFLCLQGHQLSSKASCKAQSRTSMFCKILAGFTQDQPKCHCILGLRRKQRAVVHICLVFLHAVEGFITRPVCCTYTWRQPGFSSGPELITALWLYSSENSPETMHSSAVLSTQLQLLAQVPLQTPNTVFTCWLGFVFLPVTHNPLQEGLFYSTIKKWLKATSHFYWILTLDNYNINLAAHSKGSCASEHLQTQLFWT